MQRFPRLNYSILWLLFFLAFNTVGFGQKTDQTASASVFDHHVHQMSPALIKLFKDAGVPFSRPDEDYSDISKIASNLGTNKFNLVSMAYIWGHSEFGEVENEYEKVKAENDYLLASLKSPTVKTWVYCGVNPLKDYAVEEIKRCKNNGAYGVKLHFNANQVYLTEPAHVAKLKPVLKTIADNKMPLLLHFDNSHPKTGAKDVEILFDQLLAGIEPINIRLAHFGTSGGFNEKTKIVIDAFLEEISNASKPNRKHRFLFDISAVALDKDSEGVPKLNDKEFKELAVYVKKIGTGSIVFGTDYPLYSATDYIEILKKRVGFTDSEIKEIGRIRL